MNKKFIYLTIAAILAMPQLLKAQNVGIGTTTPTATLDVNGNVKISGGAPGVGKVLTSDANGLAFWKAPEQMGAMTQMVNDVVIPYGFTNISIGNTVYNPMSLVPGFTHFKAPSDGFYHFDVMLWFEGYTGNATNTIGEITIAIVDAASNFNVLQSYIFKPMPNEKGTKAFSTTIPLDANQQVGLLIVNGNPGTTITLKGSTTPALPFRVIEYIDQNPLPNPNFLFLISDFKNQNS